MIRFKLMIATLLALAGCSSESLDSGISAQVRSTESPAESVRKAVVELDPGATIQRIRDIPMQGFKEVFVTSSQGADQLIYISEDGGLMVIGELVDLKAHRSLTTDALIDRRVEVLTTQSEKFGITYKAASERQTIYVFTDVDCDACTNFHNAIADLNSAGVTVKYLAFPTGGNAGATYDKMRAVWCSTDRKAALEKAIAGNGMAASGCDEIVMEQYRTAMRLGVSGTPTILTQDGRQYPGFPSTERLLAELGIPVLERQTLAEAQ